MSKEAKDLQERIRKSCAEQVKADARVPRCSLCGRKHFGRH